MNIIMTIITTIIIIIIMIQSHVCVLIIKLDDRGEWNNFVSCKHMMYNEKIMVSSVLSH